MSANQACFPVATMARVLGVSYGAARVHADLRGRGERHGRKRIARLMREAGLLGACHRHGGPTTTRRDKDAQPAPDLVDRNFTASGPNQLWLADITYVPTAAGSCISLLCWTPGAARPSAGRWRTTCGRSWCWTRWRQLSVSADRRTSFITATRVARADSIGRRSTIREGVAMPTRKRRSDRSGRLSLRSPGRSLRSWRSTRRCEPTCRSAWPARS